MKQLIIATNNNHKIEEMKKFFASYDLEILSLKDVNIVSNPNEDGKTFKENAFIKASSITHFTSLPILSDDSGLVIDALDGFPGVYSSRFMEDKSYKEKCQKIIDMLKDKEDKKARFECVLCLMNVKEGPLYFMGKHEGKIVSQEGIGGFGYDPIFYSLEKEKTFANLSIEEKNEVSHRGRALKKLIEYLEKNELIVKNREIR